MVLRTAQSAQNGSHRHAPAVTWEQINDCLRKIQDLEPRQHFSCTCKYSRCRCSSASASCSSASASCSSVSASCSSVSASCSSASVSASCSTRSHPSFFRRRVNSDVRCANRIASATMICYLCTTQLIFTQCNMQYLVCNVQRTSCMHALTFWFAQNIKDTRVVHGARRVKVEQIPSDEDLAANPQGPSQATHNTIK
jgi:hypothetical protein